MLTRRNLLASASAAAVAPGLPASAKPVIGTTARAPSAPMPTWIVGTPGEADFQIIRAPTYESAVHFRCVDCDFADDPDPEEGLGGPDCECCDCTDNRGYEATRVERWDGRPEGSITSGDWVDAGFDGVCDRCGYEASQSENGCNIGGKAVCGDCMTMADWETVNPEIAAELRAEMAEA